MGARPPRRRARATRDGGRTGHNRVEIPGLGSWACAGAYADVATGGELAVGEAFEVREPTSASHAR
jgi:hypothetical protein